MYLTMECHHRHVQVSSQWHTWGGQQKVILKCLLGAVGQRCMGLETRRNVVLNPKVEKKIESLECRRGRTPSRAESCARQRFTSMERGTLHPGLTLRCKESWQQTDI